MGADVHVCCGRCHEQFNFESVLLGPAYQQNQLVLASSCRQLQLVQCVLQNGPVFGQGRALHHISIKLGLIV